MSLVGRTVGAVAGSATTAVLARNNARIRAADPATANPRPTADLPWHRALAAQFADIRAEWDRFVEAGGRLPHIEDVLGEHQGNIGAWRMGLVVHDGHPSEAATAHFPRTLAALAVVPGLRAALWSAIDSGTELTEHCGPNAGVLRYHLGVDCGDGSTLRVGDTTVPYRDGEGILFDDTAPHAAWNRSLQTRVTLFCEIERPLAGGAAAANRRTQRLIGLAARGRGVPDRADEWHRALNP